MTDIFNKANQKQKRRFLRNNMPKAEAVVWTYIKNKQILGQRFLRQYSIGSYVVDFYCPKLRLVVEIDGPSHLINDAAEYDSDRQKTIETLGLHFLRFRNDEVYEGIADVINRIENRVDELLKSI